MQDNTYDNDFYAWANTQAELLRTGNLQQADNEHSAEEIESMGKGELRALENRLAVLFAHLLKWRFQPTHRSRSWELTVKEKRRRLRRHLAQKPSLKSKLTQAREDAYGDAVLEATQQTGLAEDAFPIDCPFSVGQTLDDTWWPA
jgi:hypothetical protein